MDVFYENLAHYTHGLTTMFFVFISIVLYRRRERNSLVGFLCSVMIFWSAIFLKDVAYLVEGMWANRRIIHITVSVDMLCIPAFAMFLFEVVRPGWASFHKVALMLLPTVVLAGVVVVTDSPDIFNALIVYSNMMAVLVAVLLLRSTRNFNRYIKMNYSYTETISISWLRTVVVMILVLLALWSAVTVFDWELGRSAYYVSSIAIFTYIYLRTMRHHVVAVPDMLAPSAPEAEASGGAATKAETARFAAQLREAMDGRRMYLNPMLTLREVAAATGTNRTYLSEYLNRELRTNFYDYVNSYRVKEAERILRAERNAKLEEVSERCGFNSLSTFLRSFEKANGTTPTKFRTAAHICTH
jgi:AraC-like DNA-binding protein